MSILDIIDKDKLKSILNKENFDIIQKIYNKNINEQKLDKVQKEIEKEYIITEINITRGGNVSENDAWNLDNSNTKEYIKYKYSIKSEKNSFELTIIEYNNEDVCSKFISCIHIKTPCSKIFTKCDNCDFFLHSILFDPLRRENDELIDMGFYRSDLLYLDPIKLIHETFEGVEDYYYCL